METVLPLYFENCCPLVEVDWLRLIWKNLHFLSVISVECFAIIQEANSDLFQFLIQTKQDAMSGGNTRVQDRERTTVNGPRWIPKS